MNPSDQIQVGLGAGSCAVTEGPAIDDTRIEPVAVWPFAYSLSMELDRLGIHSGYEHFDAGMKLGEPGYRQYNVMSEAYVKDLARHIGHQLGKFVVFGSLWMPPGGKGVIYAGVERHQNVYVRRLLHYHCPTDDVAQRYDVLVKRAEIIS